MNCKTKADILTGKQPPAFTPESSLLRPAEMSAKCRQRISLLRTLCDAPGYGSLLPQVSSVMSSPLLRLGNKEGLIRIYQASSPSQSSGEFRPGVRVKGDHELPHSV